VFWRSNSLAAVYFSRHAVRFRIFEAGKVLAEQSLSTNGLADAIEASKDCWRTVKVLVFLGSSEVRLGVLPKNAGASRWEDWEALATKQLLADAGLASEEWATRFDKLRGSEHVIAAAVRHETLEALHACRKASSRGRHTVEPWALSDAVVRSPLTNGAQVTVIAEPRAVAVLDGGAVPRALAFEADEGDDVFERERRRATLATNVGNVKALRLEIAETTLDLSRAFQDFRDLVREAPA
jgi:hypothetical protein